MSQKLYKAGIHNLWASMFSEKGNPGKGLAAL
jgi:hypothetical protein